MKANNPKNFAKAKPDSNVKATPPVAKKGVTKDDVIKANTIDSVKDINVERTIANKKLIVEND